MPLYEYQCDACGHRFELIKKYSDPPLKICPKCGGAVHKLQSAPAFQFKGTGWYVTDYAKKEQSPSAKEDSSAKDASETKNVSSESEKSGTSDKTEKTEKTERSEKSEKTGKAEKSEQSEKREKREKKEKKPTTTSSSKDE